MKKNTIYIALGLLCLYFSGKCQTANTYKGLKVGDKIPDITISNLINYPVKSTKLSSFHGKILLLDFWSTWCSNCITAFPEVEKLQKEFKKDLQVLLVNSSGFDDISRVKFMLSRIDNPPQLPIAVRDTSLFSLFPINVVPHYVWVDRNGFVMAITYANLVTAQTMRDAVNLGHINAPEWVSKH